MPPTESKSGTKTTELWAGVATVLGIIVALDVSDLYKGVFITAVVVAYIVSRGLAKNGVANFDVAGDVIAEDVALEKAERGDVA